MRMIDAHQHFWNPARGDYSWIPPDNAVLNRVYRPADLAGILAAKGVAATVLVQAAATVHETEYLLGLADAILNATGKTRDVLSYDRHGDDVHVALAEAPVDGGA